MQAGRSEWIPVSTATASRMWIQTLPLTSASRASFGSFSRDQDGTCVTSGCSRAMGRAVMRANHSLEPRSMTLSESLGFGSSVSRSQSRSGPTFPLRDNHGGFSSSALSAAVSPTPLTTQRDGGSSSRTRGSITSSGVMATYLRHQIGQPRGGTMTCNRAVDRSLSSRPSTALSDSHVSVRGERCSRPGPCLASLGASLPGGVHNCHDGLHNEERLHGLLSWGDLPTTVHFLDSKHASTQSSTSFGLSTRLGTQLWTSGFGPKVPRWADVPTQRPRSLTDP